MYNANAVKKNQNGGAWQSAYQQEQARTGGSNQGATTSQQAQNLGTNKSPGAWGATGTTPGAAGNNQFGQYKPSGNWYETGLTDYGGDMAMADPSAFYEVYANQNLGLPFGSSTASWLSDTYDPYKMAAAFGGGGGEADRLAQGTQFMNLINAPGNAMFSPGAIVSSALQEFAKGLSGGQSQLGSQLLGLNPAQQLDKVIQFLGAALSGTMAPDALEAYLKWIQAQGMQIVGKTMVGGGGNDGGGIANFEKGGGNIATHLMKVIGANGGL